MLQRLVEQDLVSVQEIQEVTGRGSSTVYRWMRGQTQPDFEDLRLLIRHIASRDAQRSLLALFTRDLPVSVEWLPDDLKLKPDHPAISDTDGSDAVDMALLALEYLPQILSAQREAMKQMTIDEQQYGRMAEMIDAAIGYLALSKQMMRDRIGHRRRARPA